MKNASSIIKGIIFTIIAIVLISILTGYLKNNDKGTTMTLISYKINDSKTYRTVDYNLDMVDNIIIRGKSEGIVIEPTAEPGDITVELRGSGWNIKNEALIQLRDSELSVKVPDHTGISFGSRGIVIRVPADMNKENLNIQGETYSGSIKAAGFGCDKLKLTSKSGSIKIAGINAEYISLKSISGSIAASDSESPVSCNSNSGSIKLEGAFNRINVKSTSGSIKICDSIKLIADSFIESTSGSVKVALPSDSDFRLTYKTSSGSYNSEFDGTRGGKSGSTYIGTGSVNLNIKTRSGSIKLEKI